LPSLDFQQKLEKKVSERWLLFADLADPSPEVAADIAEEVAALERARLESRAVAELLQNGAFKLLEDYRLKRIVVLQRALEAVDLATPKALALQAELKVLRGYENFMLSKITTGLVES
jgi:hypothetical protein